MDTQLEEMRQQLTTLKQKLNEQEIVNERLMRRSMRNTVNNITRRYYVLMALAIVMVPYGYWVFVKMNHFSIAFWIATSLYMLVCGGVTYYNSRKISDPGLMSHSLVEARKKVASAKKFDSDWLLISIPTVILWLGWFCYESYHIAGDVNPNVILIGGIVGAIIGGILGFTIHFKTQRQYQDIIDQIEDLTNEA